MKRKYALLISLSLTFIIFFFYHLYSEEPGAEKVTIKRAIDGDTLELSDGRRVRLSNVNSPEKGESGYLEAYEFLKNYENSSVELKINGVERYGRILGEIYSPDYLNLQLIKLGLAHSYLVEEKELSEFKKEEERARKSELGIWRKAPYFGCLDLNIDKENEKVKIENNCESDLKDWTLKDESTNSYKFSSTKFHNLILYSKEGKDKGNELYWGRENAWNNDKDSVFIRDDKGLLVYYSSYGY